MEEESSHDQTMTDVLDLSEEELSREYVPVGRKRSRSRLARSKGSGQQPSF